MTDIIENAELEKKPLKRTRAEKSEITFEAALARLEVILAKLESGESTLEQSLALFEEGVRLSKLCNGLLDKAEQKVVMFEKGEDGELQQTDFKDREAQ